MTKSIKSKALISAFIIALLCVCLGVAFIGMPTSAASDSDASLVFGECSVRADKTAIVSISIKNNPGIAVATITLDYDKTALTLTDIKNGEIFPTLDTGRNLFWSADENCNGDGVLATLTFEINEGAEAKDYIISAVVNEAFNEDYEPTELSVLDGRITVYTFVYGDANGDGEVNAVDVLTLRKYMANYDYDTGVSTVTIGQGADANGDGSVTAVDVLLMRKYMANYDYDTGFSTIVLGPPTTEPSVTTTAPVTQTPVTTAPVTTMPVTTAPVTTTPVTTMPVTTSPVTQAPVTQAPVTTAPEVIVDPFESSKYKPEDYYALYVQNGLLLHLNFATANKGTDPLVGGESYTNVEVSATKRFQAVASNYTPFLVYSASDAPVHGGTAPLLTPWYFENWYIDGYFNTKSVGSGSSTHLQLEEPLEYAKLGERNGMTIYVRNTNMYNINYYIGDGVWARKVGASKWGDGCLIPGINNSIYYGTGIDVSKGSGYTMNFSVKTESGSRFKTYMGPRFNIKPDGKGMVLNAEQVASAMIMPESGFKSVSLPDASPTGINNYSMTVDLSDWASLNATYGFAVNGISYQSQTLPCNKTIESLRQFFCDGEGISLYAIRTYNRVLTSDEIKQNHFADIAIVNKLDIEGFLMLDDAGKINVYKAFDGFSSDSDAETLQTMLDEAVEANATEPPVTTTVSLYEKYGPLYVQDGLLYHLNFAEAKEGNEVVGGDKYNDASALANERFSAAVSNYEPYLIYLKDGLTNPIKGGTATIATGGWKFITPYIYSYWYDAEGNLAHTGGSVATFDNFVTEEGKEGIPYYIVNGEYKKIENRTINGETKPIYALLHTAPANAIGYYISAGTWGAPSYSSAFGNGYFDARKGNVIKLYEGGVKEALAASNAFSVELVAASLNNQRAAFFIGPRLEFIPTATTVKFIGSFGNEMLAAESGYTTIQMSLNGQKVNAYSFVFDLSDIANYNYTLNAYGNGTNYSTQNLVSKTNTFSATSEYVMRGNDIQNYAIRVYKKALSANEVLRNHFADIALFNTLDITKFLKLDNTGKLKVYKAFEGLTIDSGSEVLQPILDKAVLDAATKPVTTKVPATTETPVIIPTVKPEYAINPFTGWQEYEVIFENAASSILANAIVELNIAFDERYDVIPEINSDFLVSGASVPTDTLEILVGLTNRAESIQAYESLKANDYYIGMINNRLVIVGGSDKATAAALRHFITYLMAADGLYYPANGYKYEAEYPVKKLTVGGTDISEFVIVRGLGMSAGERNLVTYISEIIGDLCGVSIETVLPSATEQAYEILVGNTGRALTSKELEVGTYSIEQTDTKIALYGNGASADAFVLKYFIQEVLLNIPDGDSYDIDIENVSGEKLTVPSLVTSNLPETLGDYRGKYDDSVASTQATMDRFLLSVNDLPEEVSVVSPILIQDYTSTIRKQVYVSNANGNDRNDGSENAPFKTISKAVAAMKNTYGGVIWIEGDTYELSEPITIGAAHSGTVITPLFIKSYGDRDVTLTSNIKVESKGFRLVDVENDEVAARLHDDVQDKVYCINLYSDLGWTEKDIVDVTTSGPARLYVDGEEFTLARFPNAYYEDGVTPIAGEDYLYFTHVYDTGSVTSTSNLNYWEWVDRVNNDPNLTLNSVVPWETRIPDTNGATSADEAYMGEEIKTWVNTGDIWYYGNTYAGWEHAYYTISPDCVHDGNLLGIAKDDGCYSLKSVQPSLHGARKSGNSATGRNTYYLFNAIEALDVPGEWFIDKETGYLYIYPKTDDINAQQVSYSGSKKLDSLLRIDGASYVVVDGVGVDGCNSYGIRLINAENIVLQNITTKNTMNSSVRFDNSKKSALINSNLSYSYGTMVTVSATADDYNLTPTDIFIQNNVFSNPPPSVAYVVSIGGCRTVVSHNHFIDCCINSGAASECIIEYNLFEGGNRFITDGGMVYLGGYTTRGHHVRYNLFHMFKATHQAVYFDTMGSGMYSYGNVISTLGAWTNSHKAWYSSTGHGNVCFGNIMVLRNAAQIDAVNGKDTDEQTEAIRKGDDVNESGLFYYYYGDGAKGNSEAGPWWKGIKVNEINRRFNLSDEEAWRAHSPDYMNSLLGDKIILAAYELGDYAVYYVPQQLSGKTFTYTDVKDGDTVFVPQYEYLDASGNKQIMAERRVVAKDGQGITLSYDDISAMERLSRQPAFSAIWNNIFLGGSSNPNNLITNNAASFKGFIKDVTYKADNFFEFDYDKVMVDAENGDYTITDEAWARIESELGESCTAILKGIDYTRAGTTYGK